MLTLALLSSGTVLAGEEPPATAAEHLATGDYFLTLGTPRDLKAAIEAYSRVAAKDREGKTPGGAEALEKIARALGELQRFARPTIDRANQHVLEGDLIAAERWFVEALEMDPFNRDARRALADVRTQLRAQATAMERMSDRGPRSSGLGVPPAAERITNDPNFSVLPYTKDRG